MRRDLSPAAELLEDPPRVRLSSDAQGSVEVHLHGAQATRWTLPTGREVLYLSPRAEFGPAASIRGGIPVIFPQFADLGPLAKHGFARTAAWQLGEMNAALHPEVVLALRDDPLTRARWPHRFHAQLTVRLGDALEVGLTLHNPGTEAFTCTAALHSYLRVADAERARVEGLEGCTYLDKVHGGEHRQQGALRIAGEVDRVYREVGGALLLRGEGADPALRIESGGFPDAVVWNPGPGKGPGIADLGGDEWRRFVCVEAAAVARPLRLEPGERWTGWQRLLPLAPAEG